MATTQTKASLPPFSLQVSKTGSGLYVMDLVLDDNLLKKTALDLTLYSLKAGSYVPRIFIPDATLLPIAKYTTNVKLTITAYLGATFPGTMLLHVTSALWSFVSFQQFVSYFVFINMAFPFQVNLFFSFTQPQVWDFVPNPLVSLTRKISQKFPGFINDQAEEEAIQPQKFIDENQTPSFVENGGGVIAINMEMMLLLWILYLLRKISFFQRNRLIKTVYESLRWNIVIRIFLENGTPLAFAIFLQGRVISLDSAYHYIVLSLMLFSSAYFIIMLVVYRLKSSQKGPSMT